MSCHSEDAIPYDSSSVVQVVGFDGCLDVLGRSGELRRAGFTLEQPQRPWLRCRSSLAHRGYDRFEITVPRASAAGAGYGRIFSFELFRRDSFAISLQRGWATTRGEFGSPSRTCAATHVSSGRIM